MKAANPRVVGIAADDDVLLEVPAGLAGRNVLRTDQHGGVTLLTDGVWLWIEVGR